MTALTPAPTETVFVNGLECRRMEMAPGQFDYLVEWQGQGQQFRQVPVRQVRLRQAIDDAISAGATNPELRANVIPFKKS